MPKVVIDSKNKKKKTKTLKQKQKQKQIQKQNVVVNINTSRIAKQSGERKARQQAIARNTQQVRTIGIPYIANNPIIHTMFNSGETNRETANIMTSVPRTTVKTQTEPVTSSQMETQTDIPQNQSMNMETQSEPISRIYRRQDNPYISKVSNQNKNVFETTNNDAYNNTMSQNNDNTPEEISKKVKEIKNKFIKDMSEKYDEIPKSTDSSFQYENIYDDSDIVAGGGAPIDENYRDEIMSDNTRKLVRNFDNRQALQRLTTQELAVLSRSKGINIRKPYKREGMISQTKTTQMSKSEIIEKILANK
jgi:hypothetical protein